MTKETVNVLLNLLKQVNVNVMAEGADLTFQALSDARKELLQILADKEEVSKKE